MSTVHCPHCLKELNAGDLLSQMARGRFRRLSPEHKAKLRESLVLARERLAQQRAQKKKLEWLKLPLDQT